MGRASDIRYVVVSFTTVDVVRPVGRASDISARKVDVAIITGRKARGPAVVRPVGRASDIRPRTCRETACGNVVRPVGRASDIRGECCFDPSGPVVRPVGRASDIRTKRALLSVCDKS